MESFLFVLVLVVLVLAALVEKSEISRFKKRGIKVCGVIIENKELAGGQNDGNRLGGNINTPTVLFHTLEGLKIIGEPVEGFVTQHEVVPPVKVHVIYDKDDPRRFCIDFS